MSSDARIGATLFSVTGRLSVSTQISSFSATRTPLNVLITLPSLECSSKVDGFKLLRGATALKKAKKSRHQIDKECNIAVNTVRNQLKDNSGYRSQPRQSLHQHRVSLQRNDPGIVESLRAYNVLAVPLQQRRMFQLTSSVAISSAK